MAIQNFLTIFVFFKLKNTFTLLQEDKINQSDQYLYDLFQQEKQKYQKRYQNQSEEDYRFEIFKNNFYQVYKLNQQNNNKGTFYNLNDFFDISNSEYDSLFGSQQFFNKNLDYFPKSKIDHILEYHSDQIYDENIKMEFLNHLFNQDKIDPLKLILSFRQNQLKYVYEPLYYQKVQFYNHFLQNTFFDVNREEWCIGEFLSQYFSKQAVQNDINRDSFRRLQSIQTTDEQNLQIKKDELQINENNLEVNIPNDIIQQQKTQISENTQIKNQQDQKDIYEDQNSGQQNEQKTEETKQKTEDQLQAQNEQKQKKKTQIDLVNELYFKQRKYEQLDQKIKNPFDKYSSQYDKYDAYDRIVQQKQDLEQEKDKAEIQLNNEALLDYDLKNDNLKQKETQKSTKQSQQKKPQNHKDKNITEQDYIIIDGIKIPKYLNWNEDGKLNYVKNQRYCNACYAFGAISALESHQILYHDNQQRYSEQEVIDCNSYNSSCFGGQPYMVFDYIKEKGIHKEENYEYVAIKSRCKSNTLRNQKIINLLKGYLFIRQGMKNLILAATVAPIVVVSYASQQFKFFQGGIYYGEECDGTNDPNHTSILYGYNINAEVPYLMLKTNWGQYWGEYGHYKLAIGDLSDDNYGPCLYANTPYNVMPIV